MEEFFARAPGLYWVQYTNLTLYISGGCPEMNPNFRYFIVHTEGLAPRRLLRRNLAIMAEQGWEWLPEFCRSHELTLDYNPRKDCVPGSQHELEADYKAELIARHGIALNHLFRTGRMGHERNRLFQHSYC